MMDRGWFDRRTFRPAAVIVLVVAALVAVPTWLNHAIAEPTTTVSQGDTVTLEVDEDNQVVIEPIQGWEKLDTPSGHLALRNGKADVTIEVAATADNLDRYYQRMARAMRSSKDPALLSSGAQALPGKSTTTDAGFSGVTGTLVNDGRTGEASVLAKGDVMIVMQSLVPPDQVETLKPQITAMVNSVREQ